MLTLQQLATAAGCGVVRAQTWLPAINAALDAYAINTPKRAAAFLAQIGHESGGLRFTAEIWGPTPEQALYERDMAAPWPPKGPGERNWKAYELGNVKPGDGHLFRGRGPLQDTGRANYARLRDKLRLRFGPSVPDFEAAPDELLLPKWGSLAAAEYWAEHGCNELADAGDFLTITRRINGGTNGLADRQARLVVATTALSTGTATA